MTRAEVDCILITINNHQTKTNDQITAPELLVINEEGESLGILKLEDALKISKGKNLDLIEVSPFAKPPVARIYNFDKYRYQQEKKIKKQKGSQKEQEVKQVQISIRSATNDLLIKAKKINEFLGKKHLVRVMMVLRGREKANKEFAINKLKSFLGLVAPHKVISDPKQGGRGIFVQIQAK